MGSRNRVTTLDVGLLLIRALPALVFMFHGSQKLFGMFGGPGIDGFAAMLAGLGIPMPTLNAYLAASAEVFGGFLLLLGLGTRIAAIPLVVTMLVAALVVHGAAFSLQHNGMEYALTLAVVTAGLAFTSAGRLSLDAVFANRLSRATVHQAASQQETLSIPTRVMS